MTPPNATRADVLREFTRIEDVPHVYSVALPRVGPNAELMADEIVRLRAQLARERIEIMRKKLAEIAALRAHRDAMIRRVEALPTYDVGYRDAVLAALREGGDDA